MFTVSEMNLVKTVFKTLALFSIFAVCPLAGTSVFAAAEKAEQKVPATCIPASRENLGWWKNMNDSFNAIARERNAKIVSSEILLRICGAVPRRLAAERQFGTHESSRSEP